MSRKLGEEGQRGTILLTSENFLNASTAIAADFLPGELHSRLADDLAAGTATIGIGPINLDQLSAKCGSDKMACRAAAGITLTMLSRVIFMIIPPNDAFGAPATVYYVVADGLAIWCSEAGLVASSSTLPMTEINSVFSSGIEY